MGADLSLRLATGQSDARPSPDRERARHLYERHAGAIFGHCLRQLRDRSDAEDAAQATFLNALRGLQGGVVPQLERPWLFAIANRVISNRRRSDSRRRRVETPRDLAELDDRYASPAVETDELAHLDEALAALPDLQRRALLLREWQGLSYHEIRDELELSQGAVEQLIFRARRSLARELTQPSKRTAFGRVLGLVSLFPRLKAFLFEDPDGVASLAKIALSAGTIAGAAAVASVAVQSPAGTHHRNVVAVAVRATSIPGTPAAAPAEAAARRRFLEPRHRGSATGAARAATDIAATPTSVGSVPSSEPHAAAVTASSESPSPETPALGSAGTNRAAVESHAGGNTKRRAYGQTKANRSSRAALHTTPATSEAKPGVGNDGSSPGHAQSAHAKAAPASQSSNNGANGSAHVPSPDGIAHAADGSAVGTNPAVTQAIAGSGAGSAADAADHAATPDASTRDAGPSDSTTDASIPPQQQDVPPQSSGTPHTPAQPASPRRP